MNFSKIILFLLPFIFLFSCSSKEDSILKEVVKIIPKNRDLGSCFIGNTQGDAKFYFSEDGKTISVEYRAIIGLDDYMNYKYSSWTFEKGELENLEFSPDIEYPEYVYLSGNWNNGGGGDNSFILSLNPKEHQIRISIANYRGNWKYVEVISIPKSKIKEIESLFLKGDKKFDEEQGYAEATEESFSAIDSTTESPAVDEAPLLDSSSSYPDEEVPIQEAPLEEIPSEEE